MYSNFIKTMPRKVYELKMEPVIQIIVLCINQVGTI